jgi:hypothetical protein
MPKRRIATPFPGSAPAALLETLLDKLRESDPITGVPGSLTADLEAAREICETVEAMIEGKEWML